MDTCETSKPLGCFEGKTAFKCVLRLGQKMNYARPGNPIDSNNGELNPGASINLGLLPLTDNTR